MQFILVSSTLLCAIAWTNYIQGIHGWVHNCKCTSPTDTRVPRKQIVSYSIQEESICNVRVIMFLTVKRKTICADPNSDWTKKVMQALDEKKSSMEAQKKGAESFKTPATYSMNPVVTPSTVSPSTLSVSTSAPSLSTSPPSGTTSAPSVSTSAPSLSTSAQLKIYCRFLTVKRKTICSDPNSSWTKKVMWALDEKKTIKEVQKVTDLQQCLRWPVPAWAMVDIDISEPPSTGGAAKSQ